MISELLAEINLETLGINRIKPEESFTTISLYLVEPCNPKSRGYILEHNGRISFSPKSGQIADPFLMQVSSNLGTCLSRTVLQHPGTVYRRIPSALDVTIAACRVLNVNTHGI